MNQRQRDHLQYRLRDISYKAECEIGRKYEQMRRNVRQKEYPNVNELSQKAKIEQIKKGIAKMKKKSDIKYDSNAEVLSMIFTFADLAKAERERLTTEMHAKLDQLNTEEKEAKDKIKAEFTHVLDAAILGDDKAALKSIENFQKFCKSLS